MKSFTSLYSTVGIVANRQKPSAPRLLVKIRTWLKKRGVSVLDSLSQSKNQVVAKSDLVLCLGGDGTLLSLAPLMEKHSVPILGINLGDLGFLTEVKQDEVFFELERALRGESRIEKRWMLSCQADSAKYRKSEKFIALNDIVINREGLSRMIYVDVRVNDEVLTHFAGDGVVLATPTGSTAYSLSAGGAVVHPKLEGIVITPICPHASALRSLVVSAAEKISVRLRMKGESCRALLTADGQKNLEIDDSFRVVVTQSSVPLKLVKSSKRGYFATLREIFKFPA